MKRWNTGWNDYWFTASLILDEAPLLLVFLEWFMDWVCYLIGFIPWIGDHFHVWIHDPIFQFIWRHTKTTWIPLPYKLAEETFTREFKEFEKSEWEDPEDKELIYNNWIKMMELHYEFMQVYKKLQKHELISNNKEEKEKNNAS